MKIVIHYRDTQAQNKQVPYWGSEFVGHTTNKDLPNKIEDGTSLLNMKNLNEILMDGPNVNWKFLEWFISKRESEELPGLIHIRSGNFHALHNDF